MELQDFVAETIKNVIDGIIAAQAYGRTKGARVIPGNLPTRDDTGRQTSVIYRNDIEHNIEFDVAVTATEERKTDGGMGIVVGPIALGSRGRSEEGNQSVSRIRFSVPVVFPRGD